MNRRTLARLPDALSYARIALTLGTYLLALRGDLAGFTVAVLVIVLTDMLDGPIARRLDLAGRAGANLDSVSDFTFYASLPVWAWIIRPQVIIEILPLIVVFAPLYVAANLLARVRLGQYGFHSAYTRLAATVGVIFGLTSILWGMSRLLYWTAVGAATLDLTLRYAAIAKGPGERPRLARPAESGPD